MLMLVVSEQSVDLERDSMNTFKDTLTF